MVIIPLDTSPNQKFNITVPVDGNNLNLTFEINYNEMAQYWVVGVGNSDTGENLLASVPLVPGEPPAQNILSQYAYLGIGSAYLVKVSDTGQDRPDSTNLGTDFVLLWGDTVAN